MFCMHCGKQLEDGSRFCIYCGKSLAEVPPAPVEVPVEVPVEEPAPVAPPENYHTELPPVQPVQQPTPVPQDANFYIDSTPPVDKKKKKKGKKTGLVIAIVLVLLLAVGCGLGFYFYSQHVYQEHLDAYKAAETLLKKGDYDGALDAFLELEDFEDAADRAKDLQKLQEDYDHALQLLEDKQYPAAYTAFQDLGDYRDSENYVKYEITYQEACFLMDSAGSMDDSAVDIYETAADSFLSLGNYADSADLASNCFLQAALVLLEQGDYDRAMSYAELLSDGDVLYLYDAYQEYCADAAFLEDIVSAMVIWLDENESYSLSVELEKAMSLMDPYANVYFDNASLASVREDFMTALGTMYSSLDSESSVSDAALYYYGMYQLYSVADTLYADYGVFSNDAALRDTFVGFSDTAYAYYVIESSLTNWWLGDESDPRMSGDHHYHCFYTNDTGYSFTLYARVYFYDAYDNLVDTGDWMEISVSRGGTADIPTIPYYVNDDGWSSCYIEWSFDNVY